MSFPRKAAPPITQYNICHVKFLLDGKAPFWEWSQRHDRKNERPTGEIATRSGEASYNRRAVTAAAGLSRITSRSLGKSSVSNNNGARPPAAFQAPLLSAVIVIRDTEETQRNLIRASRHLQKSLQETYRLVLKNGIEALHLPPEDGQ